jgi:hypothetical protein
MAEPDDLADLFERTMLCLETSLAALARDVPPPARVPTDNGHVFRFAEKSIHQAIVQKLTVLISNMRASEMLLNAGFILEVGALQRQIDDAIQDVEFLALGWLEDNLPERHHDFLDAFYAEEFVDGKRTGKPHVSKHHVPREKIRAYVANNSGKGGNPSEEIKAGKTLYKAYSGYVHGASQNIMELYGGKPAKFHVRGMADTPIWINCKNGRVHFYLLSLLALFKAAPAFEMEPNEEMKQLLSKLSDAHKRRFF